MDIELLQSIERFVLQHPELRLLAFDESNGLRERVAARFNLPEGGTWWWECLPTRPHSYPYSAGDGLDRLRGLLPDATVPVFMFVTDEEPPPWPCIAGS